MKLGEVISIKHGYPFDGEHISSDDNGVVLVTPGNFKIGGGFQEKKCKFFTGDIPDSYVLQAGDLIVTMTDLSKTVDTLGYSALVPENRARIYLHNQRIGLVSVNDDHALGKFIYYVMQTYDYQRMIANTSTGSTVHHTSPAKICDYDFELPSIRVQQKIVDILSAYDDLIENNQKQIKLLEEAAQRLYKEWFVDLHFPGWENATIIDGVPAGWEKKRLIDIVDVQYGFAFNGALFNSEKKGTPIIRIRNIPSAQTEDYTTETAEKRYIVHNGDILVGMDGEFHINTWGGPDGYLVQRVCSFRPHDESIKGYLLQAIVEPVKFFEKTVVGATVAHLGKKHIDGIEIITAPAKYYVPFQAWYEERQLLMNQNVLLAEARNRVLPKLMSGESEV